MLCSDHFGVGKCISLKPNPSAWPGPVFPAGPVPWYGPYPPCCPTKKKSKTKKKKTKILIKVCGDLTGLDVTAKKKSGLLTKCKTRTTKE